MTSLRLILAEAVLAASLLAWAPGMTRTTVPATLGIAAFGAKCDGRTDDAEAIGRALDAAGRGSIVMVPATGTACMLSRFVALPDGVRLKGEEGRSVLMAGTNNTTTPVLLQVGSDTEVSGITFDGQAAAVRDAAPLIQGYKISNVKFDHVTVRHSRGTGLVLSTLVSHVRVSDSRFIDIGNGWKESGRQEDRKPGLVFCCGQGNRENAASGNSFSDIGLDALQFSDQEQFQVVGNRFELSNEQADRLASPDYPAAIFLLRDTDGLVANNIIAGAQGNCVDAPGGKRLQIRDNVIDGCGGTGIGLFSTKVYGAPLILPQDDLVSGNIVRNVALGVYARLHQVPAITVERGATNIEERSNR